MSKYRETPQQITRMPPGIPYIIGNELAERFSFYGMKAILMVFLTDYLLSATGDLATMSEERGKAIVHLFVAVTYLTPLLGAIISDIFLGKYLTILTLSLLYCFGHGSLALMDLAPHIEMGQRPFLYAGLVMIAFGAGAIKPCVSAHVGDQFGSQNKNLLPQVFNWFYFAINVGAAISTLLTPIFLDQFGPWLAFGVPGVLMAIATFVFWLGRHKFVHVPPAGWRNFKNEVLSRDGVRALINLAPIFLIFIPMFWALFDQTASAWVSQAKVMNREVFGVTLLPSQIQAVNPFLILILIPIFVYGVYPVLDRVFGLTPLKKISIGLFVMAGAFTISALIEQQVVAGAARAANGIWNILGMTGEDSYIGLRQAMDQVNEAKQGMSEDAADALDAQVNGALSHMPSIGWQMLAYIILTASEVMVSITALEFAYTQSPKRMKSFVMGIFLASVALGNFFTSAVNFFIEEEDGGSKLEGASYYWFFTIVMLVTAVVFALFSRFYRGRTYIQGEDEAADEASMGEPELAGPEGEHGQHPREDRNPFRRE